MRVPSRGVAVAACSMTLLATAVLAQVPTTSSASPQKSPITHEKLWMMKRVGSPAVSPDGKWVIFSILEPSYEPDKEVSDLWMVATDGNSPPRRLTNTRASEGGVTWSPDSRNIAF